MTEGKIIVTLTSWRARLRNVPVVLETILSQTKVPDKIVLNLSSEEFPEKEKELPSTLIDFFTKHNDICEINWIDGKNIKAWKKTIPTMLKYPNDCIICIDDDFLYPSYTIERLYKKHLECPNNPISYALYKLFGKYSQHCGWCSLDKAEYYPKDIGTFLNTDVTNIQDSDSFMTYMALKNGTPVIQEGTEILINLKPYNSICPYSSGANNKPGDAFIWMIKYYNENKEQ